MKWSNKPRIVEAVQFLEGKPVPNGVFTNGSPYVITIHGQITPVQYGDFIVTEPDGIHHYPCKSEIWLTNNDPLQNETGNVVCGDAKEYLNITEPVKCIIMDPPDNIGLKYDGYLDKRDDYYGWIELLLLKAVTRCQILWLSYHPDHQLEINFIVRNLLKYRHPSWSLKQILWLFNFGQYNDNDFTHGYRPIIRLSALGARFYPDAVRVISERQLLGDKRAAGMRVPSDVWQIPRVTGNSPERRSWHPTQHPEEIMERMIQFSCNHFETTLDLFAGSGTVHRVCKRLGKPCVSVEQSPVYCSHIREGT